MANTDTLTTYLAARAAEPAQTDGVALLQWALATGLDPATIEGTKLALHCAPHAFFIPDLPAKPETLAAINRTVDRLAAAVRRYDRNLAEREAEAEAARARRLAILQRLGFGFEDDQPNQGPMAPVDPQPPAPPAPPVVDAPPPSGFERVIADYAAKAGVTHEAARKAIQAQIKARSKAQLALGQV